MDISHLLPVKGNWLVQFKGGPLDKQGWHIDLDVAPAQIIADGHHYELVNRTLRDISPNDCEGYLNDPDELFDSTYQYKGKRNS